jgi:hypothetical protein
MSSSVEKILAFEVNFGTTESLCPTLRKIKGCWTTTIILEEIIQFSLKRRVSLGFIVGSHEFIEWCHECFWGETSSKLTIVTRCVGDSVSLAAHDVR